MSRENPCKTCEFGAGKLGSAKYQPGCNLEKYRSCIPHKEHEEYLESHRKYKVGNTITSVDELLRCKFVYWHGKIIHIAWIESMTYRTVITILNHHGFRRAIRKESNVK